MGVLVGLGVGVALLLLVTSGQPRRTRLVARPGWRERTRALLAAAGVEQVSAVQFAVVAGGLGAAAGLLLLALTRVPLLAVAGAGAATLLPRVLLRSRARQRRGLLRELWPDVVDNLASAVRAGLSLPEALTQVGVRGPESLRPAFQRFGEDYRATGSFGPCLDRLTASLADPVADRVCETLRMAREVGGSDVGSVLRTLSAFLREDNRTRAELETRQGWTVNAARLALASPWAVLVLLASGSSAVVDAYNSPTGAVVLLGGGAVSLLAYRVMLGVGRLPDEPRVLRGAPAAAADRRRPPSAATN